MKEKIVKALYVVVILFVCIFEFSIYSNGNVISNDLVAWGLRRNGNHQRPILDSKAKTIIEKYDGITIGSQDSNNVYLTFDCGYEAGYTEKILDILKEKDVKAAFFITGHYYNTSRDIVKRMIEEGHIVGNHTVNHKCMQELSDEEIKEEVMKLHNTVFNDLGYEMKYFRSPKGEFSERVIKIVKELGYTSCMWSFAYDDWDPDKQDRLEYGKKKILENSHQGEVILLHATSKDNSEILGDCIDEMRNQGFIFESIKNFK